ncbi:MAG: hypothetical protein ACREQC_01700 [Candidatus Binataceae bacterium]
MKRYYVRRGPFAAHEENGFRLQRPLLLAAEAEFCADAGRSDDALAPITDALHETEELRLHRSLALRLRADTLVQSGAREPEAEAAYLETVECAGGQSNRFDELQTTKHSASWLKAQGRREEARAMLAEIYNWFTEGFDTADLKEAQGLLDELSG